MQIDPATGIPLDNPEAPLSGEVGMGVLDRIGYDQTQLPLAYDVLAGLPGLATSVTWNMNRVSNTIVGGARNPTRRGPLRFTRDTIRETLNKLPGQPPSAIKRHIPGQGGFLTEGIPQTFSPRNFFRFTSAQNIDPRGAPGLSPYEGRKGMYSPFGFAAAGGNAAFKFATARTEGMAAANKYLGMGKSLNTTEDAFSRGTFGRMAAIARIGDMSDKRLGRSSGNIARAVSELGDETAARTAATAQQALRGVGGAVDDAARLAARGSMTGALGSTIRGQASGRIAGYFAGAQSARLGTSVGLRTAATGAFKIGAERAISSYGSSSLARFAGSRGASMALRAAGPIGTMFLVRDLAMIGGKLLGAGARTIADAGRSLVAPLNKGVMGGQFRDNSTAATARQRGVMAIANSRLNMRSVLGHEAAAMQSYYG